MVDTRLNYMLANGPLKNSAIPIFGKPVHMHAALSFRKGPKAAASPSPEVRRLGVQVAIAVLAHIAKRANVSDEHPPPPPNPYTGLAEFVQMPACIASWLCPPHYSVRVYCLLPPFSFSLF